MKGKNVSKNNKKNRKRIDMKRILIRLIVKELKINFMRKYLILRKPMICNNKRILIRKCMERKKMIM